MPSFRVSKTEFETRRRSFGRSIRAGMLFSCIVYGAQAKFSHASKTWRNPETHLDDPFERTSRELNILLTRALAKLSATPRDAVRISLICDGCTFQRKQLLKGTLHSSEMDMYLMCASGESRLLTLAWYRKGTGLMTRRSTGFSEGELPPLLV